MIQQNNQAMHSIGSEVETIKNQVEAMERLEREPKYGRRDYFASVPFDDDPSTVDHWCRYKMVEWCYSVVDFINFSRETVGIAMSYLDRVLSLNNEFSNGLLFSRKSYQLAAMTCLYTAIKVFEPKIIDANLLAELSRGSYTADDFKQMELEILFALNWHLNDPTPFQFLEYYLQLLPLHECNLHVQKDTFLDHARYQIELAMFDYSLVIHEPSKVAVAALSNSLNSIFTAHGAYNDGVKMIQHLQRLTSEPDVNLPAVQHISLGMERLHNTKMPAILRRASPQSTTGKTVSNTCTDQNSIDHGNGKFRNAKISPTACVSI